MEKKVFWRGEVGIALLTTFPKHADLYYDLIQEEQLVLIVNRDCALAKRIRPGTPIDILEAKDETFVSSRPGHSVRSIQDALFITRDMKPKIDLETISIEIGKTCSSVESRCYGMSRRLCGYLQLRGIPLTFPIRSSV